MTFDSAAVTRDFLLAPELLQAPRHYVLLRLHGDRNRCRVVLRPVALLWEVCEHGQTQVLWTHHALQMHVGALGTLRTEAKEVVLTELLDLGGNVGELALFAHLAEASLEVGTLLRLLGVDTHEDAILCLWVRVDAVFFLGTVVVFVIVATNRHLVLVIAVEVVAVLAPSAIRAHPVHAHKLLALLLVHLVVEAVLEGGQLVDTLQV